MLFYTVDMFEAAFQFNLQDWCVGGPCPTGWTRTGPIITLPEMHLTRYRHEMLSAEDILAKNSEEVNRWHLSFMRSQLLLGGSPTCGTEQTAYWQEYLGPRLGRAGHKRIREIKELILSMKKNKYNPREPVWVADVSCLDLGFHYFRFDGCHRACIAKLLGLEPIPTLVFDVEVKEQVSS